MSKALFGTLSSGQEAEILLNQLQSAGFPSRDISVLFADKNETSRFIHEKNTKAPEGAIAGVGTGGVVGGVIGWLAGIGSLAIPGVGPLIAAGPIMAALSGTAIGATVGGLIGSLVGMGMPEIEAKNYERKLKEGDVLVAVHADTSDRIRKAREIFKTAGVQDVSETEDVIEEGLSPMRTSSGTSSVRPSVHS